ncbi:hypothetical protein RSAG8_12157, partial [Rhizoctonia solani AG-8 WAC10335]
MAGPQRTTPSRARQQDITPYNCPPPAPLATAPTAVASDATLSDDNSAALNAYPDLQQAIEDGSEATLRAAASPVEKTYYDICDELERIRPDFFERLGAMGSDSRRQVRKDVSIKGIVHKYQLGVITPVFLAYAAAVLRFSLSSEAHFNDTGGTFNYIDFYNQIRCYLESPKYEKTNKILLAWRNKKVFPNLVQTYNDATGGEEPSGMLSLLDAEIEREQSDSGGSKSFSELCTHRLNVI